MDPEDIEPHDYDRLEQQAQPLKGNHLKGCGSLYIRKSDFPSKHRHPQYPPSCGYRRVKYKKPTFYHVKNHHARLSSKDLYQGLHGEVLSSCAMNVLRQIKAKHHTRARNHDRTLKTI
jgi:hypothetical protein